MFFSGSVIKAIKKSVAAMAALALIPVFLLCGCDTEKARFNWVRAKIDEYYYPSLPSGWVFNGSVKDFVDEYLDSYSEFYTAEEYKNVTATSAGNMSGVGISYEYVPEGVYPSGESGVHLVRVVGNSPAYSAGIRAGEFVQYASYNGTINTFDSNASFSQFLDSIPQNTTFSITTDKDTYTTCKTSYTASYCYMATKDGTWDVTYENGNMKIVQSSVGKSCLPDGAAYLRLDQFYGNAAYEMASLIEVFNQKNCTSLILDLRRNGGGYVNVMSDISAIYTGQLQNPLPSAGVAEYKNGNREYFMASLSFPTEKQLPAGVKVSVLADNGTASASEALIGVLISNGVIGYSDVYISDFTQGYLSFSGTEAKDCRTYGKGIMQTTFSHPIYGYAIKLTTAKIFWPDGVTSIHDVGLGQDMGCKTVEAGWNVTYDDEQLSLAVEKIYGSQAKV
ncbi:MAG: S41 family peptidase [Candidatus Coproplasma sp.]